jgi:uncharacterized protein YdaU (DUF1376 family)
LNYYPFHIGDYLSATRHLSWEEDAAYRRLLDTYYTTEKPLPADLRAVCRLVLATTDGQREAVRVVLEEFFRQTEEGWINTRADAEIEAMREKQQKQRDKANKRWAKPATEPGIASAVPQQAKPDATASETRADAMPPTPTPTPTPTPKERVETRRASRLPPDWALPPEWRDWARSARPDLDPAKVADRFRDFWVAKAGRDGAKLDWAATWRNWVRQEAAMTGRNNGQHPGQGDVWAGAT